MEEAVESIRLDATFPRDPARTGYNLHGGVPICIKGAFPLLEETINVFVEQGKNPSEAAKLGRNPGGPEVFAVIDGERACAEFTKWRQGFSPKEHIAFHGPSKPEPRNDAESEETEFETMTQGNTLERLDELIGRGEAVVASKVASRSVNALVEPTKFGKWRINCLTYLKSEFGHSSIYFKEFEAKCKAARRSEAVDGLAILRAVKADILKEGRTKSNEKLPESEHSNQESGELGQTDPRKVFVVYGRNEAIRRAVFSFLRSVDLLPIEWPKVVELSGQGAPYIGDALDAGLSPAKAIVVVMTPDDEARLREEFQSESDGTSETELTGQARPNVLFEAGLAFGFARERTIVIQFGILRDFSDIVGRHVIRMDNSIAKRQELLNRLRTAGCALDTVGTDWHTEGDFDLIEKKAIQPGAPKFPLEPCLEIHGPQEVNMGAQGRGWSLSVVNRCSETLDGCTAILEEILFESPNEHFTLDRWPKSRELHWAGQPEEAVGHRILIGQTGALNIVNCDNKNEITLAYRGSKQFRSDNHIGFDFPFLVLVSMVCIGGTPLYAVCRVDPVTLKSNIHRGLTGKEPFQIIWQGTERPSLMDFQTSSDIDSAAV